MAKVNVEITMQDINAGRKCSTRGCPISSALRRKFNTSNVFVGTDTLCVTDDFLTRLPAPAMNFIDRYDYGQAVAPFAFELEVPEQLLTQLI